MNIWEWAALGLGLGVLLGLAWVAVALGVLLLAVGLGCVFAPMTPKMTSKATTLPSAGQHLVVTD